MSDRLAGVVIVIFAALYGFEASRLKAGFGGGPISAKSFPLMLAALLGLVGIIIILTGSTFKVEWPQGRAWFDLGIVVVSFVAYAYLIVPVGFIAATTLETGLVSQRFGARPWQALATGLGVSVALYVLFVNVLGVSLPTGRIFKAYF